MLSSSCAGLDDDLIEGDPSVLRRDRILRRNGRSTERTASVASVSVDARGNLPVPRQSPWNCG